MYQIQNFHDLVITLRFESSDHAVSQNPCDLSKFPTRDAPALYAGPGTGHCSR